MKSAIFCLVLLVSTAAAPVSCPRSIDEAGRKHVLDNNLSVFDGPPEQGADLIGGSGGPHRMWEWEASDLYLVCRYKDTVRTVTFHAVGAKHCYGDSKPIRAFCK